MKSEKIIVGLLVLAGLGMLVWSIVNAGSLKNASRNVSPERYAQAVADELSDKCATPPGYTDAEWQEHMGHHPDRYAECLSAPVSPSNTGQPPSFQNITVADLAAVLDNELITLVDTHIPEQPHIPGTDAFIPYNEIGERLAELPPDKNAPIVLYCRSGNMSEEASKTLAALGYTNVYNLVGGTDAWKAAGYEVEDAEL